MLVSDVHTYFKTLSLNLCLQDIYIIGIRPNATPNDPNDINPNDICDIQVPILSISASYLMPMQFSSSHDQNH